mmetsp:Transcript_53923/g.135526  ORF Transcript_53923/g.135526 Transcript_53923/m.135526 type:complete len:263 (-) Transcript_53923:44-832(-)
MQACRVCVSSLQRTCVSLWDSDISELNRSASSTRCLSSRALCSIRRRNDFCSLSMYWFLSRRSPRSLSAWCSRARNSSISAAMCRFSSWHSLSADWVRSRVFDSWEFSPARRSHSLVSLPVSLSLSSCIARMVSCAFRSARTHAVSARRTFSALDGSTASALPGDALSATGGVRGGSGNERVSAAAAAVGPPPPTAEAGPFMMLLAPSGRRRGLSRLSSSWISCKAASSRASTSNDERAGRLAILVSLTVSMNDEQTADFAD